MSDIKAVIQLLCQHLNILLNVNLKPENFRLAKFNHNDQETIHELWTTLQSVCLALGATIAPSSKGNIHLWVKLQLASRGYRCAEFFGLPPDNSTGSRELLLSLMWIIAKENALSLLTQKYLRQSPLLQEYSDAPAKQVIAAKGGSTVLREDSKIDLSVEDQINYCLWLANRIKHNINQIQDFEEERIKNTHQVHQATAGSCGLPHLSVFETKLVRDPELLNEWMPKLSELNELLSIHTKWLKRKSAFWEWMESIVQLKEKDLVTNTSHQRFHENALTDFMNALHLNAAEPDSQGIECNGTDSFPRFFIASCFAKSSSNLVRKASSSDILADVGIVENGAVIQASDWLAHIDSELQEVEKSKHDQQQQLNSMLIALTQKLGLVAISDASNGEAESEDCSK